MPGGGADPGRLEGDVSAPSDAQLRRYLLRQLPDAEAEAIEAAYFADATLAARLEDLDDDLAHAYMNGALDAAEFAAFKRVLEVPGRAARVAFIAGVGAAAVRPATTTAPAPPTRRKSGTGWTALAAAAVLLLALGGWFLMAPTQQAPPSQQVDNPPTAPAPPVTATPTTSPDVIVALALPVTATRSGGAAPTVEVPEDADIVSLRLAFPLPPLPDLAAEVRGVDSGRVWRGVATPPAADAPASTTAEVRVPVVELPAGDYILTLRRGDEPVTAAFFRVVRR
jgi:hypothetical protein